jgi:hypothetical protein
MTTIRITRTVLWVNAANAVQGETIGNLNIPAVLDYRVKTMPMQVGLMQTNARIALSTADTLRHA